nr:4Fe-4S binding protein [candidate division Zixibacteria bacterium]
MVVIFQSLCLECGGCVPLCPEGALFLSFEKIECDQDLCTMCRVCIEFCPTGAIGEDSLVEV